jgi:hypothetical protein
MPVETQLFFLLSLSFPPSGEVGILRIPLQDGQWEQALWLFNTSTSPDFISYSAAMSALEKGGRFRMPPKAFGKLIIRRPCLSRFVWYFLKR